MILRRITEHVRAQNWFAVGVFNGIQVANWNSAGRGSRVRSVYVLH